MSGGRIVLTTFGSLGDLFPFLAMAIALKERGHQVVVVTNSFHRERVESSGIEFVSLRPDIDLENGPLVRQILSPGKGLEFLVRDILMPAIRDSYADLFPVAAGADLLVTHPITFAGPVVARKLGLPWASVVLSPLSFLSAHDPVVTSGLPVFQSVRKLGVGVNGMLIRILKGLTERWTRPLRALERTIGLLPGPHPMFEGQHSPELVLALFSPLLASARADWPQQTLVTGFVFQEDPSGLDTDLVAFLKDGPPPVVFTLGSSLVKDPGSFYEESFRAIDSLGCRAVLVGESLGSGSVSRRQSSRILSVPYAPHGSLFPRASLIVHQGGIGTLAQAMKSGKPMIVVPHSYDQSDNAFRAVGTGVARSIPVRQYRAPEVARVLKIVMDDQRLSENARKIGNRIECENGIETACNALENLIERRRASVS
ncbi:MAG: glycosyltransferase [Leptospirales bacterium]